MARPGSRRAIVALVALAVAGSGGAGGAEAAKKAKMPKAFAGSVSGSVVSETGVQSWTGTARFVPKSKGASVYVTSRGSLTRTYTRTGCTGQIGPTTYPIGREHAAILFLGKPRGKRAGKRFVINPDIVWLGPNAESGLFTCLEGEREVSVALPAWIGTDSYPFIPRSGAVAGSFEEDGVTWRFDLRPIFKR